MPRGDKGGNSKDSGIRCVAANCGNTNADGVSLHTFPKDPTLLKKMERFCETKKGAWPGPTEYSALCSIHFEPSCFPFRTRFEIEKMGVRPKRVTLTSVDVLLSMHQHLLRQLHPVNPVQQYFSYIMATNFSGGGSRSTRREPPTLGRQLVNCITCGCESSAPFL